MVLDAGDRVPESRLGGFCDFGNGASLLSGWSGSACCFSPTPCFLFRGNPSFPSASKSGEDFCGSTPDLAVGTSPAVLRPWRAFSPAGGVFFVLGFAGMLPCSEGDLVLMGAASANSISSPASLASMSLSRSSWSFCRFSRARRRSRTRRFSSAAFSCAAFSCATCSSTASSFATCSSTASSFATCSSTAVSLATWTAFSSASVSSTALLSVLAGYL
mmetsp:Transcript_12213/g.30484  ORF Transcript_12213/g.30484 Transcript_12213/m.30484 type:complete len:217 (-) Transcript_12213:1574-2224(-)